MEAWLDGSDPATKREAPVEDARRQEAAARTGSQQRPARERDTVNPNFKQ